MPSPTRHLDGRKHRYDIGVPTREDPNLIVCPSCGERAVVIPEDEEGQAARAVCHHCGFSKRATGQVRCYYWGEEGRDPHFGCPLWMQTHAAGHGLWAFNRRHLDLLEGYVGAQHRERVLDSEKGWRNASVASRLPTWMTAASNREAVLAGLQRLREKL